MRNSKRHSIDKTKCVNTKKTIPFQFFITMKKNLFRKFLALFLTGTLLAGVGCKDYDDDIKEINNKIEGLKRGKLARLEAFDFVVDFLDVVVVVFTTDTG